MTLYLKRQRKYKRSKLKISFLFISKFRSFNFDLLTKSLVFHSNRTVCSKMSFFKRAKHKIKVLYVLLKKDILLHTEFTFKSHLNRTV